LTYANIELSNPAKPLVKPLRVRARVDTGAMMMCVPQDIARHLELHEIEQREVTLANATRRTVPHVGPIQIRFDNRTCAPERSSSAIPSSWAPSRCWTWTLWSPLPERRSA
jgi:clan AA aspartic protease